MSTELLYRSDTTGGTTLRGESETTIANFYPVVKKVAKYKCGDKVQKKYVVEFYDPYYIGKVEIDSKSLEKFDYSSVDDALQLNPTISTAGKEMAYYIRDQAKSVEVEEKLLLDTLGWHNCSDNHVYCAGNMVIGEISQEDYVISDYLSKYRLDIDVTLSEKDAAVHTMKLMDIAPGSSCLVFASGLLGPLRQIILDAGLRPPCIPYVEGESQCKKTTLVKLCTIMYNRSELQNDSDIACKRVSSSEFKLEEIISELKDTTFLLDDLFKADNKMKKIYEGRIENAIRNFADNSTRSTARSAFKNNSNIIITAEYLIESKTDVGRLFLICIGQDDVDVDKLSECQKNPLALSTFYCYFIRHLSLHYDAIVERLKKEYSAFRCSAYDHESKFGRLYEQFFLIDFAFSLYLEYAVSVGLNINKELVKNNFQNYVRQALKKQNGILISLDRKEVKSVNFSKELVTMISDGSVTLLKKGSECFEKGGFIYITTRYFNSKLREKYERDFSARSITSYFRDRYISEVDADNRQKKYKGRRYLKLNKKELMKDAYDTGYEINNLFYN